MTTGPHQIVTSDSATGLKLGGRNSTKTHVQALPEIVQAHSPETAGFSDTDKAERSNGKLRVLHVTECLGGVPISISQIIKATPYVEHHYLALPLRKHSPSAAEGATIHQPRKVNLFNWRTTLRKAISEVRPTHLHLHSTVAGLLGRTLLIPRDVTIVYTPHCYAFERQTASRITSRTLKVMEKVLSVRTRVVLAISAREAELAESLSFKSRTRVVSAFNPVAHTASTWRRHPKGPMRVVAAGRICRQKDPAFFIQVKKHFDATNLSTFVDWTWIGDGDTDLRRDLLNNEVHITGWLSQKEVGEALKEADVYIHTASWEGFPLTVLEAAGQALPLTLRKISALTNPLDRCAHDTPDQMARNLTAMFDAEAYERESQNSLAIANEFSPKRLMSKLADVYQ